MGVSNPFLNPLWFWQNFLVNWILGSRGFYESAIKANKHWFKVVWDLWFRTVGLQQTEIVRIAIYRRTFIVAPTWNCSIIRVS